jgi:peroxiredoxin
MARGESEPVEAGEEAPDFTLPAVATDQSDLEVNLRSALDAGPVLLVFYQDDGMPICTSELKAFAQEHELLAEAGVQVLGMNTNGIGSHKKFQERDAFPFPLVSDFYGEATKAYGLWDPDEGKARRAVVLVGQDGRVRHVLPHFNPGNLNAFAEVFEALGLV